MKTKSLLLLVALLFTSAPTFAVDSLQVNFEEPFDIVSDGWASSIKVGTTILVPHVNTIAIWEEESPGDYSFVRLLDWDLSYVHQFVPFGTGAYLLTDWEGLRYVDLSDPLNPILGDDLDYGEHEFYAYSFQVSNGKLLVEAEENWEYYLVVFDLADPAHPQYETSFSVDDLNTKTFAYNDNIVAIGYDHDWETESTSVVFFDINDPNNPQQVGTYLFNNIPGEIEFYGSWMEFNDHNLYISGTSYYPSTSWFLTLDCTDPTNVTQTSLLAPSGQFNAGCFQFALYDDYIVVTGNLVEDGNEMHEYTVLSIENPAEPQLVGSFGDTYTELTAFWETEVCTKPAPLPAQVYDISSLPDASLVGEPPSGSGFGFWLTDGRDLLTVDANWITWFGDLTSSPGSIQRYGLIAQLALPTRFMRRDNTVYVYSIGGFTESGDLIRFDLTGEPIPSREFLHIGLNGDILFSWPYAIANDYDSLYVVNMDHAGSMRVEQSLPLLQGGGRLVHYEDWLIHVGQYGTWTYYPYAGGSELGEALEFSVDVGSYEHVKIVDDKMLLFPIHATSVKRVDIHIPEGEDPNPTVMDPIELPLQEGTEVYRFSQPGSTIVATIQQPEWEQNVGVALMQFDEETAELEAWSFYEDDSSFAALPLEDGRLLVSRTGLDLAYADVERIPDQYVSEGQLPCAFALGQAYPNPFNPSTTIPFTLRRPGNVEIAIYDVMGRLVKTLVDGQHSVGQRQVNWNGRSSSGIPVASGSYIVRLKADGVQASRRITLVK